jgi:hypothetical protein
MDEEYYYRRKGIDLISEYLEDVPESLGRLRILIGRSSRMGP